MVLSWGSFQDSVRLASPTFDLPALVPFWFKASSINNREEEKVINSWTLFDALDPNLHRREVSRASFLGLADSLFRRALVDLQDPPESR